MNRCYTPALLALACSSAGSALAQPEATDSVLEETIVISSRVPMPLRQVGTAVSVMDEQHIAMRSFNSLYDALRTQPAVSANNTGGAGGITSLQIRGEDGYRTLVLIDDIDISDTSGPQVSPRMEHILRRYPARGNPARPTGPDVWRRCRRCHQPEHTAGGAPQ